MSSKSTPNSTGTATPTLSKYALWIEPRDVWCIKLDPVWIDFLGARSVGSNKCVPFVDAVPITLWIHGRSPGKLNVSVYALQLLATLFICVLKLQLNTLNTDTSATQSFASFSLNNGNPLNVVNQQEANPFHTSGFDDTTSDSDSTFQAKRDANDFSTTSATDDILSADLHVIAHVSNLVSLQIDHYQYLFVLRLAEEMTELSTFLTIDSKRILQNHSENKSIVIGCVVPQVEITMVMPSQTPGKESSGGDGESVLPDSASLGDDLLLNANTTSNIPSATGNWNGGNTAVTLSLDQMKNHPNTNTFGSIETPSPVTNDAPEMHYSHFDTPSTIQFTSSPNAHGHNVQIISTATNLVAATPSQSAPNVQNSRGRNRNSITETGLKDLGSSLISMKKGFSNFMTSIDSALKTNPNDDTSDTISIQSDISSDSENFIMVLADDKTADCMDVMFRLNPFTAENSSSSRSTAAVEVASEMCEELDYKTNMSSPSEPSEGSTWRRRDLVSMATFRFVQI